MRKSLFSKVFFWSVIAGFIYVLFIFNEGYFGKLFLDGLWEYLGNWGKHLVDNFISGIIEEL